MSLNLTSSYYKDKNNKLHNNYKINVYESSDQFHKLKKLNKLMLIVIIFK